MGQEKLLRSVSLIEKIFQGIPKVLSRSMYRQRCRLFDNDDPFVFKENSNVFRRPKVRQNSIVRLRTLVLHEPGIHGRPQSWLSHSEGPVTIEPVLIAVSHSSRVRVSKLPTANRRCSSRQNVWRRTLVGDFRKDDSRVSRQPVAIACRFVPSDSSFLLFGEM